MMVARMSLVLMLLLVLVLILPEQRSSIGVRTTHAAAFGLMTRRNELRRPPRDRDEMRLSAPPCRFVGSAALDHEEQDVPVVSSSSWTTLEPYMLERNVTIRSVSWNSSNEESSLLQIYKGAAVAPTVPKDNSAREQSIAQLVTHLQEGVDLEEALQRNGGFLSQQPSLSHSSRSRLEQWSQLTATEREQLQHKIAVEARATQPVDPIQSLRILYIDSHLCVVNKASGVLSVPGPRRNPSIATAVYDLVRPTDIDTMDQMVVHRLDMDTSGILVLALSKTALLTLHRDFRDPLRRRVHKSYQAVLAGHLTAASTVELDVGLERDPHRPPFMRIAQPRKNRRRRRRASQQQQQPDGPRPYQVSPLHTEIQLDRTARARVGPPASNG